MTAYYNENEPYAAQWLRNLIYAGHIAPGYVDERSIIEVQASDLTGFTQCHFFAGLGGWSYALRLAGWADDRPVWTGSCPCQPFSVAGKQEGFSDKRHLWPEFKRLIGECGPSVVFGEQVAAAGKVGNPKMQKLRDRKTVIRVLQKHSVYGELPYDLQELLQGGGERTQSRDTQRGSSGKVQDLSSESSGESLDDSSKISSSEERYRVQLGTVRDRASSEDRRGLMRANGNTVQSGGRKNMGQPFDRSHRFSEGLHHNEYENSALLRKRDGQHLGRKQDPGNSEYDSYTAFESIGCASNEDGSGSTEKSSWLNLVRSDLEALGYAMGCMPIEAASAGAEHFRDRYWFVADADASWRRTVSEGRNDNQRNDAGRDKAVCGPATYSSAGSYRFVADAQGGDQRRIRQPRQVRGPQELPAGRYSASGGDYIMCSDGKWRRTPPSGVRWLGNGIPARVDKLRAFGNAIDPRPAAQFITAYMRCGT
jgi:site-specific DNA-cytosine methylase